MNENWAYIKENIERFPEYKSSIFEQGFLITNQNLTVRDAFPFFGNWRQEILSDSFHIWLHCRQKLYAMEKNGITYFLIGHAYDPFSNQADEIDILRTLAEQSQGSFELGLQTINNLTGLFVFGMIAGERMTFCGDFESMFSHDVTVPYNNRRLSDLMLMVPLADRIADRTHIDFTHELCPAIDATNISVRDVAHNNKRMWMDKIYYFITSIRPF